MNKSKNVTYKLVAAFQILAIFVLASCTPSLPVSICHATDDVDNPYELVSIATRADVEAHLGHTNDLVPAPVGGCPTVPVVVEDGKITICHATSSETNPYNEISISVNGLNGHASHIGDIFPVPEDGCPPQPLVVQEDGKITICHATGSDKNPYNKITISINGLNGHGGHSGDIIPAPAGDCPATRQ